MEYRTVAGRGEAEVVIDKSVFIGYAAPVTSEAEAQAFVAEIKKKHRDATHNVPAFVLGENNDIQRCNDDGEPSGTAGVPVLEVIRKENLRDTAVVVTRYFGGIKLGAGGLVRAYTKGAKIALDAAGIVLRRLYEVVGVTIEYPMLGMMQNLLEQHGYEIKETQYTDKVKLLVWAEAEKVEDFRINCIQWTNSRCEIECMGQGYREMPVIKIDCVQQ